MSSAKHVAVLMGGWSTERDVSLVSGKAVVKGLEAKGYQVTGVDVDRNIAATLAHVKPDVVFNALHGRWGEDGCLQGMLEIMGIPYTHSGVKASAAAMDKPLAKRVFHDAGIPCAPDVIVSRSDLGGRDPMARPYVVKPMNEGSSVGVKIVQPGDNCVLEDDAFWQKTDSAMVEKYVPGREIQVAVMGDRVLGAIEIKMKRGFYDYEAKYTEGFAEHLMPAPLDKGIYEQVLEYGLRAHQVLGCRGVTRSDFRFDDTSPNKPGELYILETNTQPGMTPLSLVPEIAGHAGVSFEDLVAWLVEDAGIER